MLKSYISGTGSYLPEKILTNADIEKLVETSDAWITERTGIRVRHLAAPHQATSDLSLIAAQRALEMAKLTPHDLDMIILATVSGDQVMPSTSAVLQDKLGCRPIMAFDLTAACSGFVYALSIADQFIKTGMYRNILVIGAETLSRIVNFKDRETCILFGDGAGAAIVSPAPANSNSALLSHHLYADGSLGGLLELPAGGSRMPVTHDVIDQGLQYVRMKGREIFRHAVRTLSQCCTDAIEANQLTKEQIDWVIPHQANIRIIEATAKQLEFPMEKMIVNIDHTGNTSAATIPVALDEAVRDGRIQRGQYVLLSAFGAGLTSGSSIMRF